MKVNGEKVYTASEILERGYLRAVRTDGNEVGTFVPLRPSHLRMLRGYMQASQGLGIEPVLLFQEAHDENRIWTTESLERDGRRVELTVELSRYAKPDGRKHEGFYDSTLDYQSRRPTYRKGQIIIPAFRSELAVAEAIRRVLRGE